MSKKKIKQIKRTYRFLFPITLSGCGIDVYEAWRDAAEAFSLDPGYFETFKRKEEI